MARLLLSVMGLGRSATLMSEIMRKDGAVESFNYHDYPMLPVTHMPKVEVHIIPSSEPPTGVGSAMSKTLAAASGKRFYPLPLNLAA